MSATSLSTRLSEAMKTAMRTHDRERLGTIRLALAEIKQVEVDERIAVDDARIISILGRMVKQRRDSISQFTAAGRDELAAAEQAEITVLQEFLPQPLTDQEVDRIVAEAIESTGAGSMQDMGKVMGTLKSRLAGQADMGSVSKKVRSLLS